MPKPILTLFTLLALATPAGAETLFTPNDPLAVTQGKALYGEHCASCHGVNLEGEAGWRSEKTDGLRRAPPHDPSGHTWHHPDMLLFDMSKYGIEAILNIEYPNAMPAYEEVLTDDELIAVFSYIKSTWPSRIRAIHDKINADYALNKQ